jgi:hypothetical protein
MANTVTLVAPDGGKVTVADAVTVSSLVYGSGYKVDGGKTADWAIAELNKPQGPKPADVQKADEAKRG